MLVEIGDKIVSSDLFTEKFVCDLTACKGACCIEGDAGAPLKVEEIDVLEDVLEEVKAYMSDEGIAAVEQQGVFYMDVDNEPVTTLVDSGACAFANKTENGTLYCTIEKAYLDKKIDFQKPISCALFPVRAKQYSSFEALNYEQIEICKPGCACGSKLSVPLYRFLKAPLIRAYGVDFFQDLEIVAQEIKQQKNV